MARYGANTATPRASDYSGRFDNNVNSRDDYYYNGTRELTVSACGVEVVAGPLTVTAGGATITAGGLTVTAGGATVTAGDVVLNEGGGDNDFRVESDCVTHLFFVCAAADNIKVGGTAAHATTPGTQSISIFAGTAPNGTLACGATLFAGCDTCVIEIRAEDSGGTATTL